ncbi:hypothetical protein CEXT_712741 [Caerostris extrusa]|nr:hypothetical protein CEXT_712741 [Caerostris extrusa]
MCKPKYEASKIVDLIFTTKSKMKGDYHLRQQVLINLTLKSLRKKERKIRRKQRMLSLESVKAICQPRIDYSQLPEDGDPLGLNDFFDHLKSTNVSSGDEEKMT